MSQDLEEGKIELIIGPMFSGKSTRLIGLIRKYTHKAKKNNNGKVFRRQKIYRKIRSSYS